MSSKKTILNDKQVSKVFGGKDFYSNSEIKDHIGEYMTFKCFDSTEVANVQLVDVFFEEHLFGNHVIAYVVPSDKKSFDLFNRYIETDCYGEYIKDCPEINNYTYSINYGRFIGTYLYPLK